MTHTHLLYHVVFSTSQRRKLLTDDISREVYATMANVCKDLGGFAIIINGYLDHVHLLVRIPASASVSRFVGQVKAISSKHINDHRMCVGKFHWQDGYGAFTVSMSVKDAVYEYIAKQKEHHAQGTFEQEYVMLLNKHGVEYNLEYVFD